MPAADFGHFVFTIAVLLAAVLALDRLEPEPPSSLVFIFLWGAGSAALIALIGELAGNQLLTTPALRPGGFVTASAAASIGVAAAEDTLMGAALVGLLWLRPQEIDGISDGVVYGSMVGLGFALIENIFYYAQATHYGFSDLATTFVLRGVASPVCQALFASLIGAGVAYAATVTKGRGLWAVGLGWLAAVTLHGAAHRAVVVFHEAAGRLGVEPFVQGGRAGQVGEDDGDHLTRPVSSCGRGGHRRCAGRGAALVTELSCPRSAERSAFRSGRPTAVRYRHSTP